MATLNEVMKNTADAIREKKGTTELIAPVDFAEEIKGITSGGGGNLSPDAIVYEPNGWYWKWVEGVPSDFKQSASFLYATKHDLGAKFYNAIRKDTTASDDCLSIIDPFLLGMTVVHMLNSADNRGACVIAFSESKYCSVTAGGTTYVGNSMYDIVSQLQPMTEVEFESFIQTNMGLQRITKEEYEALITE